MEILLKENERIDDLERNGYRIIQNKTRFCFGMDAVLLSGFAWEGESGNIRKKLQIADLGTGTGIIPLLIHGRMSQAKAKAGAQEDAAAQRTNPGSEPPEGRSGREPFIYGIEIQEEMAQMAQRSVELNSLSPDIKIIQADLKQASALLGKSVFDIVTSNPPYMRSGKGLTNPDDSKAVSRHEILCTFEDVAREAAGLLKAGGRFYLVHRPERLADLFRILSKYHLEPKRLRMVHSFEDSEATMVLLECRKGAGVFMKVEKPLIIYSAKGVYTEEIHSIYGY